MLTGLDAVRPSQNLVVPPQLVVVVNKTSLRAGFPVREGALAVEGADDAAGGEGQAADRYHPLVPGTQGLG
jgi:hypothetical protein